MKLIDTSVWVRYLRRNPDPRMVQQVQAWLAEREAAVTEVVKVELLQGARNEADFQRLEATLTALHLIATPQRVWQATARNGFTLRRAGIIVPTTDLLIATVAQQAGAELAHADQHFEMLASHLDIRTVSFLRAGHGPLGYATLPGKSRFRA